MRITFKEAVKRILICGASDVEYVLPKFDVGLVFITKPYLEDIDYKGIPTHSCFIPKMNEAPQKDANNHDVKTAITFLEENPDQYLLVHCNAGIGVSPSFVFMLLTHIQGTSPDPDEAIKAVRKMTKNPLLDIIEYAPYLPISLEQAIELKADFTLAHRIHCLYAQHDNFQTAFDLAIENNCEALSVERALNACDRFGLNVRQGPPKPNQIGIKNAIQASLGLA